MSRKIHLHIDHLSLPGYTPAERRAFIAALERELTSRAATGSLDDTQGASLKTLHANAADLRPETVARSAITGLNLGAKRGGGRP
ncbi:MAG: hypothetical protein HT580_04325 [Dechloromonas sp.]|nr:MAG: hypothetical protein HT580_04325 [Dechloromonas sp.]